MGITGQPFWVELRATLEKIGMPEGKNKHYQNFGAIFFCMPIFLEDDPKTMPISEKVLYDIELYNQTWVLIDS